MTETTSGDIKTAVKRFLHSQFLKKSETERKQLEKAKGNLEKTAVINEKINKIKEKYEIDSWLDMAANQFARQLTFGTHIAKGIHSSSKGDNIKFLPTHDLPNHLIGSHSINSSLIDASGNAAAHPLAEFVDFDVNTDGLKVRDLINSDNPDFIASLSADIEKAAHYHSRFKNSLQSITETVKTDERSKQTLWPTNSYSANDMNENKYINIVPLYPSVLTHEFYKKINGMRYSDENKEARDNRYKKTAEQKSYLSLFDVAKTKLGGTKPQGVSWLMNKQGGNNYLLPSLPPSMEKSQSFKLSKFARTVFDKKLEYRCKQPIKDIFSIIQSSKNTLDIRNARKDSIDQILYILVSIAEQIQSCEPAGWSKDSQLIYSEKLWLDPQRAELEDEQKFAEERDNNEWHKDIINSFASWLNQLLKKEFKSIKYQFSDAEFIEWEREIETMIKLTQRLGKGVFL